MPSSTEAAEMGIKLNLVVLYHLSEHWAALFMLFLGKSAESKQSWRSAWHCQGL